jgi:hypothetical protein
VAKAMGLFSRDVGPMIPTLRIFRAQDMWDVTCSRMLGLTSVGEWLSLVEHLVRDQGVGGSNPLSPTNLFNWLRCPLCYSHFRRMLRPLPASPRRRVLIFTGAKIKKP